MIIINRIYKYLGVVLIPLLLAACGVPKVAQKSVSNILPNTYGTSTDTLNSASIKWREYFNDPYLVALIDTALSNNQELKILLQEIEVTRNEVEAKKGEYLPSVNLVGGAEIEKVGRYTSQGANDANTEIDDEKEFPEPLGDYLLGASTSWEIDIWKKLRNAKKSAMMRYLSTVEGKNFMVTNMIAEIATSYYELMALDNQLSIVQTNIDILKNALAIVKLEKQSARVTELAVRRFQAEVLKNQSRQYYIQQSIIETENRINFLLGRYPQPIERNSESFYDLKLPTINAGVPEQLLNNRPDIRQAELELSAAKLDIQVTKAAFYPSLGINAVVGAQAFSPSYWAKMPESLLLSIAGDIAAPLINKKEIKARYLNANAKQIQVAFEYEQTLLSAYIEVVNELSMIHNLQNSLDLKEQQVEALTESINISTVLFRSARADYMEVLLTQREALESKFELIETKMHQMHTVIDIYQALGGGWN